MTVSRLPVPCTAIPSTFGCGGPLRLVGLGQALLVRLFERLFRLVELQHPLGHVGRGDVAGAEVGQEIVLAAVAEQARHLEIGQVLDAEPVQLALQQLAARGDVLLAILLPEPLADLRARPAGLDEVQVRVEPVAAGTAALGRQDLHLVAALQAVSRLTSLPCTLAPAAAVADLGVDAVGEVDRRRAGGQVDHLALRGEDVDPVLEQVLFGGGQEVAAAACSCDCQSITERSQWILRS